MNSSKKRQKKSDKAQITFGVDSIVKVQQLRHVASLVFSMKFPKISPDESMRKVMLGFDTIEYPVIKKENTEKVHKELRNDNQKAGVSISLKGAHGMITTDDLLRLKASIDTKKLRCADVR